MSDRYGFDFNNDGKISFEESHLTYHLERETISKNSENYTSRSSYRPKKETSSYKPKNENKKETDKSEIFNGIMWTILFVGLAAAYIFIKYS